MKEHNADKQTDKEKALAKLIASCKIMEGDSEMDILAKQTRLAIYEGKYEVDIEEPNCVSECCHPDGRPFYVVCDLDDAKSSTDAGRCTVYVAEAGDGVEFVCDLNYGEWSCNFEELLAYPELMDALMEADGVLYGEHIGADAMIEVYEAANHCVCEEYYFWEDAPKDADEIISLDEVGLGEIDGYYLLEEINDEDEEYGNHRWVRASASDPDDYGKYSCVILVLDDDDNVIEELPCDDIFDPDAMDFE